MSESLLAILGFAAILMIIVLLLKKVTVPALAFISVSTLSAIVLVLSGTFSIVEMGGFIKKGVAGTLPTACLFLFSVLFFGIMTDAGMFDRIIKAQIKRVRHSVVGIAVVTCIVAIIGHLDGSGASTFLIVIPGMLPIYKKMKMRPTTLLLICVTAMGVMNLTPWGGPTMRSASVLNMDANALWIKLMPMQAVGIVVAFATAIFWGFVEKKRGAGFSSDVDADLAAEASDDNKDTLTRPHFFAFNVILTAFVIACLVFCPLPSYLIFMIGSAVALFVNYRGSEIQNKIIKMHSGPAIMMATTLFSAGVFLGVMEESGIMNHMANMLANCIPQALGAYLPIIIGVLSVPLALVFCTDSYFYGLLPVLISVGNKFGVDPVQTAIAMIVCRNCASFISPVVPATFLGVGLANVDINEHIKTSFFWVWGVSIICLLAGLLFGILKLNLA